MNPLILAPWERTLYLKESDKEDECAVHSILWNGESTPFLFKVVKRGHRAFIFARCLESPDEGSWIICEVKEGAWGQNHINTIVQSLRSGSGRYCFARFCVVDERLATPFVILFEDGEGVWLDRQLKERARFGFSIDREVFSNDGCAVSQIIDELICDPDTDISFARRWATLGSDERELLLLRGVESQKQIQAVMRWALICEGELWRDSEQWGWGIAWPTESDSNGLMNASEDIFDVNEARETFPLVFRIQNFLVEHYIPYLYGPLREQHRCVLDFEVDYVELTVMSHYSGPPSVHDRMEARLQLSEWLEQNAYADEIEAIGPF